MNQHSFLYLLRTLANQPWLVCLFAPLYVAPVIHKLKKKNKKKCFYECSAKLVLIATFWLMITDLTSIGIFMKRISC